MNKDKQYEIIINTQMHFNDLLIKLRNIGIMAVLAIYGAAAYSLQYQGLIMPFDPIQLSIIIIPLILLIWFVLRSIIRGYLIPGLLSVIGYCLLMWLAWRTTWIANLHASVFIVLFGIILLVGLYQLDYKYYFQLLLAAVKYGVEFEKTYQVKMTNTISGEVNKEEAENRLRYFYLIPTLMGTVFIIAIVMWSYNL